jgi:NADH:ubiquinone oxidoreductase subunit 6 (subunit J)
MRTPAKKPPITAALTALCYVGCCGVFVFVVVHVFIVVQCRVWHKNKYKALYLSVSICTLLLLCTTSSIVSLHCIQNQFLTSDPSCTEASYNRERKDIGYSRLFLTLLKRRQWDEGG